MKTGQKIISIYIIAFIAFSCQRDPVQFEFPDREIITVSGLEESYTKTSVIDRLEIKPVVSSNKEGELEYLWGIYPANIQLTSGKLDTIARTKDLDYVINQPAESWILVYRVSNKNTGYSEYFTSKLSVGTEFTRGWYVLKDENEQSDLDLFLTPVSIAPAQRVDNVFSAINSHHLDGKGLALRFNTFYKSESSPGKFDNTRALFLVSEKDASVVNISTLKEIKGINTLIFGGPEVKKPGMVGNDFLTFFMVNNGQLHSMIGQGPSFGQFGGRKMKNANDDPYQLSKYHLMQIASFFFDETSSSFFSASDRGAYLNPVRDRPDTKLTAIQNNKTLLYMGMKNKAPFTGVAIFQDKTNPQLKNISDVAPQAAAFHMTNTALTPDDKIFNGEHFGMIYQDENILYFSVGNGVWSRNLANGFEQKQFTVASDETITFVQHRKNQIAGVVFPPGYSYNYICVGSTNSSGNYKIRMFTKQSGNLASEPAHILEGKGSPRDVIFIAPQLVSGAMSFPDTY